ncbi:MAG TPA: MarR family winged helix-turn-helix transcriptional regulator [Anaerolineales bacterium]|nr:MarR family winged helix-turn-helix transcriptional regulator [Anaerolineales bacterium]
MTASRELEAALRTWTSVFMRLATREFVRWMKEANLSPSHVSTLMRLHYMGHCPVSSIGHDLGVSAAAASQMVERLVSLGLLERGEDPVDRRVKRIALTQAGHDMIREGAGARLSWVQSLGARLTAQEQRAIIHALKSLTAAATELEAQALATTQLQPQG